MKASSFSGDATTSLVPWDRSRNKLNFSDGPMRVSSKWQPHPRPLSVFLARYAKRRPNVQVNLTEAVGASLTALLERGEVRVAISTAGGIQASNVSLGTICLPSLQFVAAYNRALGLANRPTMDVRKLGSFPLLLLESSFAIRAAFAACRIAEFKPNIAFESRTPHTLLALAEAGHGVAVVPSVMPTHRYDLQIVRLAVVTPRTALTKLSAQANHPQATVTCFPARSTQKTTRRCTQLVIACSPTPIAESTISTANVPARSKLKFFWRIR